MIRLVFIAGIIGLGMGVALAQEDPIAARKALMKANGEAAKTGAAMMKGEAPFDLDKARKVFATFENAGEKAPALFPDAAESDAVIPDAVMPDAVSDIRTPSSRPAAATAPADAGWRSG